MNWLLSLLRAIVLFCVVILSAAIVLAQAQTTASGARTLLDEKNMYLSWGMVLTLAGIIVTIITNMVQGAVHRGNSDIHPTSGALAKEFESKGDCAAKHAEIRQDFQRIHERFDEQAKTLSRIEGKLEK